MAGCSEVWEKLVGRETEPPPMGLVGWSREGQTITILYRINDTDMTGVVFDENIQHDNEVFSIEVAVEGFRRRWPDLEM